MYIGHQFLPLSFGAVEVHHSDSAQRQNGEPRHNIALCLSNIG